MRGEYVGIVIDDRIEDFPTFQCLGFLFRLARIDVNLYAVAALGVIVLGVQLRKRFGELGMSELLRRDGKAQERADQMVPVPCQVPVQSPPGRHVFATARHRQCAALHGRTVDNVVQFRQHEVDLIVSYEGTKVASYFSSLVFTAKLPYLAYGDSTRRLGSQTPVLVPVRRGLDFSSNSLCLASATSWKTRSWSLAGSTAELSAMRPSNHRGCRP